MKKIFFFVFAIALIGNSFASPSMSEVPAPRKASEIMIPVGKEGKLISLQELSTISKDDLESMTGRKMNTPEKIAFKSAQRKLKKGINNEGEITSKRMQKMFYADGESGFHLGGFALGFFVGLIGVLIAYLIKDDYKSNRVKWAWFGFGASLILSIVIFLALYRSVYP